MLLCFLSFPSTFTLKIFLILGHYSVLQFWGFCWPYCVITSLMNTRWHYPTVPAAGCTGGGADWVGPMSINRSPRRESAAGWGGGAWAATGAVIGAATGWDGAGAASSVSAPIQDVKNLVRLWLLYIFVYTVTNLFICKLSRELRAVLRLLFLHHKGTKLWGLKLNIWCQHKTPSHKRTSTARKCFCQTFLLQEIINVELFLAVKVLQCLRGNES